MSRTRHRRPKSLGVAAAAVATAALAIFGGSAASAQPERAMVEIRVLTLPIANALPMDLGINKGFFAQQGIEIKKTTLQSGNDVVLGMANNNGDVAYAGFVPMMIGSTTNVPLTLVAASEVEGTSNADNWQNILVKGSSSIRTPADLAGKTVAVNALKGVGEIMIRAAFEKLKLQPPRLTAIPFPTMRTALNNGQVDAIWVPEPFLSQGLNIDGDRIVMAPGPVLGRFFPIGGYAVKPSYKAANAALVQKFRTAMNRSLIYAQTHPAEVRAMLPAGTQNVRLPIWTTLVDRSKLQQLAGFAKKYDVITKLPNMRQLVPTSIASGLVLQGTATKARTTLLVDGKTVKTLNAGPYTVVVSDRSKKRNFVLRGPGVRKQTSVQGVGRTSWTLNLRKGTYRYGSAGKLRSFKVV
jgi:NitT/TauT family transport system substrate-binding protein